MNQQLHIKHYAFAGKAVKAIFMFRPKQPPKVELYSGGHALAVVGLDDIPDFIRLLQQVYVAGKEGDNAN